MREDITNPINTPGANQAWGTDAGGNTGWVPYNAKGVQTVVQSQPASQWAVAHNLGREVLIQAYDTTGAPLLCDIDQNDFNTVLLNHLSAMTGKVVFV